MRRWHGLALIVALAGASGCKKKNRTPAGRPAAAAESLEVPEPVDVLAAAKSTRAEVRVTDASFTETDAGIGGPDSVRAGAVRIRLTNRGGAVHELRLLRLPDDAIVPEILAHVSQLGELPRGLAPNGGAGPLLPGQSIEVMEFLRRGTYLVIDRMRGPDGKPWFTRGLIRTLRIYGAQPRVPQLPSIEARSALLTSQRGWKFGAALRRVLLEGTNRETTIPRGENVIMLENFGGAGHDVVLLKGNDPFAMRAYADWLAKGGPAPPIVGGMPGLFTLPGARMRAFIRVTLDRGSYIIFCPNHNPSGFDFELGEFSQFIVY